jgi:hypothetical protein
MSKECRKKPFALKCSLSTYFLMFIVHNNQKVISINLSITFSASNAVNPFINVFSKVNDTQNKKQEEITMNRLDTPADPEEKN